VLLHGREHYDEAAALYKRALARKPDFKEALLNLVVLARSTENAALLLTCGRMISRHPECALMYFEMLAENEVPALSTPA